MVHDVRSVEGIGMEATWLSPWLRERGFRRRVASGAAYIHPPLCAIPRGPFIMGSDRAHDPQSSKEERPRRTVQLAQRFRIGRFPVTVAEYACALDLSVVPVPPTYEGISWDEQRDHAEHPVVNITWYAARAYADWLASITGEPWDLPTEVEWEKAARGTDGRIYPWGNVWDRHTANIDARGPQTTSPVSAYPGDLSPYGVYDLAGNVSEWTRTSYTLEWDDPCSGGHVTRIRYGLKGGSWFLTPRRSRAADHSVDAADSHSSMVGMRLVLRPAATDQGTVASAV
jgi:formylglycine-generating enzyme required for sulfatase activity